MADADFAQPDWMANLPVLSLGSQAQTEQPNLFTSALSSGFHEALGNVGGAAEAVGKAAGWQGVQDWGSDYAARQQAASKEAGREDLEGDPWSVKGALYALTKGLPQLGGAMLAGSAATGAAAAMGSGVGEAALGVAGALGAGAFMFPQAVGGNVEAAKAAHPGQPLSGEDAAKSLLLGAPEAAAMAVLPLKAHGWLTRGATGDFLPRVLGGGLKMGAFQGAQAGVQEAVTQQAFTPDMPVADRAEKVVQAALSGGLQGAVFGGLSRVRRAAAPPVTTDSPTEQIASTVDQAIGKEPAPTPAPAQIGYEPKLPSPENMTPAPPDPSAPHAATPTPELMDLARSLEARGADRSEPENVQRGLVQQEVARRTMPGLAPGEGTLFTPEQVAQRAPEVEATRQKALAAIGIELPGNEPWSKWPRNLLPEGAQKFFGGLNAASEPELVNALNQQAETYKRAADAPAWFKNIADDYGIKIGTTGKSPGEMLLDADRQQKDILKERDAAVNSKNTAAIRAANKAFIANEEQISNARRLLEMHTQAEEMLDAARPVPEPAPGEPPAEPEAPPAPPPAPTPDPTAQDVFKSTLLAKMSARDRVKVEPVLSQLNASSEPELVNALRTAHSELNGGTPDRGLGALLNLYGIADKEGVPIDLKATKQSLLDQQTSLLDKSKNAPGAGEGDLYFRQGMKLRGSELKSFRDLEALHHQADDLARTVPEAQQTPPDSLLTSAIPPWTVMQHVIETSPDDPKLTAAAEVAQKALEEGVPDARDIMEPVVRKYSANRKRAPKPPVERALSSKAMAAKWDGVDRGAEPVPAEPAAAAAPAEPAPGGFKAADGTMVDANAPYPGHEEAARLLGLAQPDFDRYPTGGKMEREAWGDGRVRTMWHRAQEGRFDAAYTSAYREAQDYASHELARAAPKRPDGTEIPVETPFQRATKARAATPPGEPVGMEAIMAEMARRISGETAPEPAPDLPQAVQDATQPALAPAPGAVLDAVGQKLPEELPKVPKRRARKPPAPEPVAPVARTARTVEDAATQVQAMLADPTVSDALKAQAQKALDTDASSGVAGLPERRGLAAGETAALSLLKVQDAVAARAVPDGPFKGATETVIGTQGVEPEQVSLVKSTMRALGLGNLRVVMFDPADVSKANGFAGAYARISKSMKAIEADPDHEGHVLTFGPDNKDFAMYIKPGMPVAQMVSVISEEIGHIIGKVAFRNAPDAVKDALFKAHAEFLKNTAGLKQQDIVRMLRNKAQAEASIKQIDPNLLASDAPNAAYWRSFSEWFANNVSRSLTSDQRPEVRGPIKQFFQDIMGKIGDLWRQITGKSYAPDAEVKAFVDRMGPAHEIMWEGEGDTDPEFSTNAPTGARTVPEAEQAVPKALGVIGHLAQGVSNVLERTGMTAPIWLRRQALGWETLNGIARIGKDYLKSAVDWEAAHTTRELFTNAKNKADATLGQLYAAASHELRDLVNRHLVMLNDGSGLDSRKLITDAANRWALKAPNSADLIARHEEMRRDLDRVTRAGGRQLLDTTLIMNQTKAYQSMAARLFSLGQDWATRGVTFDGHTGVNPDEIYNGMTGKAGHDDLGATNLYYKNAARAMFNGIQKFLDAQDAETQRVTKNPNAIAGGYSGLRSMMDMIEDHKDLADRGTYSPLGRGTGMYFVSTELASGPNGRPAPAATQALENLLNKMQLHDVGVIHDTASNSFMVRLESMAQAKRLADGLEALGVDGHVKPATTKMGYPESMDTFTKLGPQYMKALVEAANDVIGRSGVPADVAEQMKGQFLARWMDMLPDQAVMKNWQERTYSSGFSKDMMKTALQSAVNQSRASTAISMQGRMAQAAELVRQEVQDAKAGIAGHPIATQDIANELWRREAEKAWHIPPNGMDWAQHWMHTLKIGLNPPYILTMASQIPTLSLPELAKKMGYARSAMAIGRSASPAFAVMRAILSSPDWASAGVRETALRASGKIPEKYIQTVLKLDNAGGLTNATYTSQQSGLVNAGHGSSKYMQMANAMGLYAEMLPRLITAFAAHDLYDERPVKGMSRDDYVLDAVKSSQFDWGPGQSSRLTGRKGLFGPASRVMLAFKSFQGRMIEKLYTETHDLFKGETPEQRREAGVFLAGHMVAMTALAGTMGLPLMGAVAGITDRLAKLLTGKDDIDTEGLYRTWLSHTFGADVGDMIAKGLPRGLGIELGHLGEGELLPGTGILQDKRKFEDASRDWMRSMAGSVTGFGTDMFLGARDMMNGDYLKGAIRVMPEGVKGLAEAYYLNEHGYEDKDGVKYPIKPSTWNILTAAMGLDPANLAQYNEAMRIKQGLMNQREFRQQTISSHLLRGTLNPGTVDMQRWISAARDFQLDHPGETGPMASLGGALSGALQRQALARTFHTPLGVRPLDLGMRNALGFVQ